MNEINVRLRQEQLRDLQEYVKDIDKDITLILQSLQWDRKHLQQVEQMVTCKYDLNHRILANNVKEHEEKCYLKSQNYVPGDLFFLEPMDANAATVVKLSAENINDIINYAVKTDPSFKKSIEAGDPGHAPLTLGRLQATYSVDERRALYDAVAAVAPPPAPRDTTDRDPGIDEPAAISARGESRSDALLALRDARRRRAKHRGAARDGYQQELRGLISAHMESFTGKWNDEDADTKPEVKNDESDDGRPCEHESDRRDLERNDRRAKYLNPYIREHRDSREDKRREYERQNKRREYEREIKDDQRREYDREIRDVQRREYDRENREDTRREYERENKEDKRREYERENREDKRREYKNDKKYKERNKIYQRDDRRRQRQYDKEYLEIKQERDDYPADRRKREERCYDYKNRKRETDRSSSRDNRKCHKQEKRHHKLKSAERRRGRSRDREYNSNYKSDIDCSYLKIKKEPLDYDLT